MHILYKIYTLLPQIHRNVLNSRISSRISRSMKNERKRDREKEHALLEED